MIWTPMDAMLAACRGVSTGKPLRIVVALWWRGDDAFQVEREGRKEIRISHPAFIRLRSLATSVKADPHDNPLAFSGVPVIEEEQPPGDVFIGLLSYPEMLRFVDRAKVHPWVADMLPKSGLSVRGTDGEQR